MKSANLVCRLQTVHNIILLHPNSLDTVNTCAYMDDVELEWLDKKDVDIHGRILVCSRHIGRCVCVLMCRDRLYQ